MDGHKRESRRPRGNVWKGLAAGMAGGLAASWTMNQFQALLQKMAEGEARSHGAQSMQRGSPQHGVGRDLQARGGDDEQDDATERVASAISEGLFQHKLAKDEKERAGAAVHYAMGITTGVLYGAVAELLPEVTLGAGLPFGAFVWLATDEGAVPAFGLSKSPTEYPLSTHAYALSAHFVYGLTAEIVRRAVRRAL